MKSRIPSIILTVFFMLMIPWATSCEKEDPCGCGNIEEQPVYFEYRYVNHAWGYQEHGWFIDGAGVIKGYEFPDDYRSPGSTGLITLQDLEHNLRACDTILLDRIHKEQLMVKAALIPGAARGTLGQAENVAADAGSASLAAYMYEPDQDAYRHILLGISGDWEQFNDSREARELVLWLKEFGVFWLSD